MKCNAAVGKEFILTAGGPSYQRYHPYNVGPNPVPTDVDACQFDTPNFFQQDEIARLRIVKAVSDPCRSLKIPLGSLSPSLVVPHERPLFNDSLCLAPKRLG